MEGTHMSSEGAKAVIRRNTEEVQGRGNFEIFEELFADDFVDHTPQPNMTPDKDGARGLSPLQVQRHEIGKRGLLLGVITLRPASYLLS
jgi:hypothetical protein